MANLTEEDLLLSNNEAMAATLSKIKSITFDLFEELGPAVETIGLTETDVANLKAFSDRLDGIILFVKVHDAVYEGDYTEAAAILSNFIADGLVSHYAAEAFNKIINTEAGVSFGKMGSEYESLTARPAAPITAGSSTCR